MKNRMKHFRKEQGISQQEIADMLGVSRQTIISIEKGKYNPSLPLAIQISRCFFVQVEDVFILEKNEKEEL
ncbi:repressor protein [Gracilibacillus halophilus YIM-C55.5]|uniref:Repressor protein n=1 Tax=Gracilibacillus halophilus YIM-C55.5 TaxID=1308866 RepID=N4W9A2_9BACI|nr:helix-turn-helix transcriptional regulator [Gracilibacillus halophilus]ENH95824.1 repressor protein [Gracilibacillus halophilus YIM-C55.5]